MKGDFLFNEVFCIKLYSTYFSDCKTEDVKDLTISDILKNTGYDIHNGSIRKTIRYLIENDIITHYSLKAYNNNEFITYQINEEELFNFIKFNIPFFYLCFKMIDKIEKNLEYGGRDVYTKKEKQYMEDSR